MVDEYTGRRKGTGGREVRSDSSMVDEYSYIIKHYRRIKSVQIPLWSMNTRRELVLAAGRYVQIPLWSMNTILTSIPLLLLALFRFLYGR